MNVYKSYSKNEKMKTSIRLLLWLFLIVISNPTLSWAIYDLPNNNADCPNNCRQIPWRAGSDQWNGGNLPVYTSVTCTGLIQGDGTTDNAPAIQSCINNASANTAVYLPAGIYYVNGVITLKNNVVLRGAKASSSPWLPSIDSTATTLKLGPNSWIKMGTESRGTEKAIASGYTKGSTTLVLSTEHGLVTGDWISVFEDADPAIPTTASGEIGTCSWCGEANGNHFIQQYAQVTGVSGNTITISRPLYYTYKASLNPGVKKISFGIKYAGIENLRLNGWSSSRSEPFIKMEGALFCWVKAVETYNAPGAAKANHLYVEFSHGVEIRDSYFHKGRDSSSDRNYGISFFFWNSDHKVENNILREHRHSIVFEGGGAGCAILYNYIDDNYTDDTSYLGSARSNHGAHPYMTLWEGNSISHITADNYWGSSSHHVFFRNWLKGGQTGTGVPSPPDWGFYAIDVWPNQNYYSFVGNVLGQSSWTGGLLRTTSSSGCSHGGPVAYRYGCASNDAYTSNASTTSINHGNYDYISRGIAYWDGGADHSLRLSMYYGTKPSFFGTKSWPMFGPDLNPMVGSLPAQDRYNGGATPDPDPVSSISPPGNLRISQ